MKETPNPQESAERVADNVLINDIPVVEEGSILVLTRENLSKLVETPLLEACEELYDKNIKTVMSSANKQDVEHGGSAYIDIDIDSLSEENKAIALKLGEPFKMHGQEPKKCVKLKFPITENSTVGDVRALAKETVSKFHRQEMTWAQRYTLDDLAKAYGIPRQELSPESFPDMYYDPETGYLYGSEEHFKKVRGI